MVNWKAIGAIAAGFLVVGAGTAGVIDTHNGINNNAEGISSINEKIDAMAVKELVVETPVLSQLDEVQADVEAIRLDMFKEDAFEAESEVLALEEIEDDDYEALFDFMTDSDGMNLSIRDARDIEEVKVEDVDTDADVDEEEATVIHELKVYYENSDGDDKKAYLKVTTNIEDGDADIEEIEEN